MLVDDGVLVRSESRWELQAEGLSDLRVPPTLSGVIQARLDALGDAERAILQRASVIGRIFWSAAVAQLASGGSGEDELDALVDEISATLGEIGFRPRPNAVRFRGTMRDFLARARPTLGDRLTLRHLFAQVGKWKRRVAGEARRRAGRSEIRNEWCGYEIGWLDVGP